MPVSSKCQYSSCPAHGRGGDRPSRRHFYPGSTMTDGQWALPAPLLPAAGAPPGGACSTGTAADYQQVESRRQRSPNPSRRIVNTTYSNTADYW